MKKIVFLIVVSLLAGCSTLKTRVAPKADLHSFKHIYVEHRLSDGNGVDGIIARELRGLGYDASSGPLTMIPDNSEIIVSYDDLWNRDFTTYYMLRINMSVRDAHTENVLAVGSYFRPSIGGDSPVAMIDDILKKLFKPQIPPVPSTASSDMN